MKVLFTLFFITVAFCAVNALFPPGSNPAPQAQTVALQEQPGSAEIPQTAVSVAVVNAVRVSSPGVLDLVIEPQPEYDPGFVTREIGKASQFRSAAPYNTVGILAHNSLSGEQFFNVRQGDWITVAFDKRQTSYYRVTGIEQYQALSPTSQFSDFIDLNTWERLTASQLFSRVYAPGNRLVLQTCLDAYGDSLWEGSL